MKCSLVVFLSDIQAKKTQNILTSHSDLHPGEGNSPNDAFTETQQERASLFLLQERFLFAFGHKTHDEPEAQKEFYFKRQTFQVSRRLTL